MSRPDIRNVVVLMLENRSFDSMLGQLYPASESFDGLTGAERNVWHDGAAETPIQVWTETPGQPTDFTLPNPDPGECFADIHAQLSGAPDFAAPMGGFADNYMAQHDQNPSPLATSVMHFFNPSQVPVISQLARAFGVSDGWFASAPCQTWPNRLFTHTGSAGGDVNNTPEHVPYLMETTFERVAAGGKNWGIYFHDFPQTATLGRLWGHAADFHRFQDFLHDAAAGALPSYSFIEPRFYPDIITSRLPNDEHPPHHVGAGEALIATVYNALRAGPGWKNTLLIVTYDEHGGCYDHVLPGQAVAPGGPTPDGYAFNSFGVRVPAVIISPYIPAGSVIRATGETPFDHTSIFKTLQELFGLDSTPLTPRTAAAPSLLAAFSGTPDNDGPANLLYPEPAPDPGELSRLAAMPPNGMQHSLSNAAAQLPTLGADLDLHIRRLAAVPSLMPDLPDTATAAMAAAAHLRAFLGK